MRSDTMQQRSLLIFQNSLKSAESIKTYTWTLDKFLKFYHIKDYDSLASMKPVDLQIMVEDYIMDLKKKINPNSIPTYYYPLQSFFESNEVDLKWKKIKKLFPSKIKSSGASAYSNDDCKLMLDVTPQLRNKTIIHLEASLGCRVGAIPGLKLKDLIEMPFGCYAVVIYEGSIEEYIGFLTPEAAKILNEYFDKRRADGEYLNPNSPVIRAKYIIGGQPSKHITVKAIHNVVYRSCLKSGLRSPENKHNGRFDKMIDHGFRKRFNTLLKLNKDIPVAITERLLGHMVYRDGGTVVKHDRSYMRADIDQMFKIFQFAIPDLTIDDIMRKQLELDKINKEKSDLEKINYVLEETVKEKDELATQLRIASTQILTDDKIKKIIDNHLKQKKNSF